MVKVTKFGGSSLASAEQFAKVGNIIRADSHVCFSFFNCEIGKQCLLSESGITCKSYFNCMNSGI